MTLELLTEPYYYVRLCRIMYDVMICNVPECSGSATCMDVYICYAVYVLSVSHML